MTDRNPADTNVSKHQLLAVIDTQTRIARLGLDVEGVMAVVAERAQALTGATGAVVEMVEGDNLVYRAATGSAGGTQGLRLARSNSLSGLCVEKREMLWCDDTEDDPRVDANATRRVGARSMVVAPLVHDDAAVGVLKVLSSQPRAFGDGDAELLALMTELISAAIYNAMRMSTEDLFHRATHDPLTGVANRSLFFDRLKRALAEAKREEAEFSVLVADLDDFKEINDSRGHAAGDAVLRAVAERMRACVRQVDTVARLGGDEFAVLLRTQGDADGARAVVDRMRSDIAEPVAFDGDRIAVGVSFGTATYPKDAREPAELVQTADERMYEDKRRRAR